VGVLGYTSRRFQTDTASLSKFDYRKDLKASLKEVRGTISWIYIGIEGYINGNGIVGSGGHRKNLPKSTISVSPRWV